MRNLQLLLYLYTTKQQHLLYQVFLPTVSDIWVSIKSRLNLESKAHSMSILALRETIL